MPDVFLCHSRADASEVHQIALALEASDIKPWLDEWNLVPGKEYTPAIEKALKACKSVAVFVGKSGRSPYQNNEMQLAINTQKIVIPVLLPGATEEQAEGMLLNRTYVTFKGGLDNRRAIYLLICGIRGEEPGRKFLYEAKSDTSPTTAAIPYLEQTPVGVTVADRDNRCVPATESPYQGLAYYDVGDASRFFGREAEITEGVNLMEGTLGEGIRFLAIIGSSGSGKSSLARAGLAHALLIKHPAWKLIALTPTEAPLERLSISVLKLARPDAPLREIDAFIQSATKDERALQKQVAGALAAGVDDRLLLVIDQFEEVFIQCRNEDLRKAFIANLLCAAKDASGKVVVLLCMRADLYERCADYGTLAEAISRKQQLLGPMRRENLRLAIEKPALSVGGRLEPALTVCLLDDCEAQPSPLPLLQLVLNRLWKKRSPSCLVSQADYESGRLAGAINDHAEDVLKLMDDAMKARCMALFLQLAEPLEDGRYVRRRVSISALLPTGTPEDVQHFEEMLGLLGGPKGRLITIEAVKQSSAIEVAHEALLRGWSRLSKLLDDNSEFLLWKKRLAVSIADLKTSRSKSNYLSGVLLVRAENYLADRPTDHTPEEVSYVKQCLKNRRSHLLQVSALAGAAIILISAAGYVAYAQQQKASVQTLARDAAQLSSSTNPAERELAVVGALAAVKKDAGAVGVLEEAVQARTSVPPLTQGKEIAGIAFVDGGDLVATAANDGFEIWSAGNTEPRWSGQSAVVNLVLNDELVRVVLAADRKTVAGIDAKGLVVIRGVDGNRPLKAPTAASTQLALDSNGSHLAFATPGGDVVWWDIGKGAEAGRIRATAEVEALAVHPHRPEVAIASADACVRIWTPGLQNFDSELKHDEPTVNYARYANSGDVLGTATAGGKAYRWQLAQKHKDSFSEPGGKPIAAAAMSGDGKRIATYVADGAITITEVEGHKVVLRYSLRDPLFALALDGSGARMITAEKSGVRVHDFQLKELESRAWNLVHLTPVDDLKNCETYLKISCQEFRDAAKK